VCVGGCGVWGAGTVRVRRGESGRVCGIAVCAGKAASCTMTPSTDVLEPVRIRRRGGQRAAVFSGRRAGAGAAPHGRAHEGRRGAMSGV
jgi:hypothetical protein